MAKRPWRPHYTRDWHGSPFVRSLELHVRCIYFELLDLEWDEEGLDAKWLESPFTFLCNRIGCHWRTFTAAWALLEHRFEVQEDGKRRSRRGQDELKKASEISEKRAKAAKQRWEANANAMPSQSQSQSHTQSQKKEIAVADAPPLPFKPDAAVAALAQASCGRFTASKLSKGQAINCNRLIREAPALGTWTLVGEWLAAGGDGWKGVLDVRSLRDFIAWVAQAQAWEANGRGQVGKNGPSPSVMDAASAAKGRELF